MTFSIISNYGSFARKHLFYRSVYANLDFISVVYELGGVQKVSIISFPVIKHLSNNDTNMETDVDMKDAPM